jgi:ankyrin repeat protein
LLRLYHILTKKRRILTLAALTILVVTAQSVRGQGIDAPVAAAAEIRDFTTVGTLVAAGADVNAVRGDGTSALLWATHWLDADAVRMLLDAGADPNLANAYGLTPLLEASRLGDVDVATALIDAGADPRYVGFEGETLLMAAAGAGSLPLVERYLAAGADVNAKETGQDQTALMWAAAGGHTGVVNALIAAGADLDAVAKPTDLPHIGGEGGRMYVDHSSRGLTALMFAARQGSLESARLIAQAGADLGHTNPDGLTALLLAVINDNIDLAAMLVEQGANPNDGSLYETVQLHNLRTNSTVGEATRPRPDQENTLTPVDLMARLVAAGGDPLLSAPHIIHFDGTGGVGALPGQNPPALIQALQTQDVAMVRAMLAGGVDPNTRPGGAPLLAAAVGGGGGRRGGFGFGASPGAYRFASERSLESVVSTLLEAGADPDLQGEDGGTALHAAAQAGSVVVIRMLADAGATLDVANAVGLTPLDLAMGRTPPPAAGGRAGGGPPPPGGRGRGGPPAPQPEAIAALRELMGLPAGAATGDAQ